MITSNNSRARIEVQSGPEIRIEPLKRDFDEDDGDGRARAELPKPRLDITEIKVEGLEAESSENVAGADGLNIPEYINKEHYLTPEGLTKLEEEDPEEEDALPEVVIEEDVRELGLDGGKRRMSRRSSHFRQSSGGGSFVN